MLKLTEDSVLPPFELNFKSCFQSSTFPSVWKRPGVVPVHKKSKKKSLKDYRPIKLLSICEKIFEWLVYNNIFQYFMEDDLISHNQSDFRHADSCLSYLLTTRFLNLLKRATKPEVYFLTHRKPLGRFDTKVSFTNSENSMSGNLLNILKDFLYQRKQRVVQNGQNSSWSRSSTRF